jgi:hypothetical protein
MGVFTRFSLLGLVAILAGGSSLTYSQGIPPGVIINVLEVIDQMEQDEDDEGEGEPQTQPQPQPPAEGKEGRWVIIMVGEEVWSIFKQVRDAIIWDEDEQGAPRTAGVDYLHCEFTFHPLWTYLIATRGSSMAHTDLFRDVQFFLGLPQGAVAGDEWTMTVNQINPAWGLTEDELNQEEVRILAARAANVCYRRHF